MQIIIDTDPGIDDALAILAALNAPELEVLGLTVVFGNRRLPLGEAFAVDGMLGDRLVLRGTDRRCDGIGEDMDGGTLGSVFTALSFAAAFVSCVSFAFAGTEGSAPDTADGKASWSRLGAWAFGIHAVSVFGIIATLFGLIATHQYQFVVSVDKLLAGFPGAPASR